MDPFIQHTPVSNHIGCVSRDEKTFNFRRLFPDQPLQFPAVRLGHNHIGDQELYLFCPVFALPERFIRRTRCYHLIAKFLRARPDPPRQFAFHPLPTAPFPRNLRVQSLANQGGLCYVSRESAQVNFKSRTAGGFTLRIDKAVVLRKNAVKGRQTQAGAFSCVLGDKKRFKDMLEGLLVRPPTGVADNLHNA